MRRCFSAGIYVWSAMPQYLQRKICAVCTSGEKKAKARAFLPPKMDGYIFAFFLSLEDFSAGGGIFVVAFYVSFLRIADSGAMLKFLHFLEGFGDGCVG